MVRNGTVKNESALLLLPVAVTVVSVLFIWKQLNSAVKVVNLSIESTDSDKDGIGLDVSKYISWEKSTPKFQPGEKNLLIYMGPCDSCTLKKYRPGMEKGGIGVSKIIIAYEYNGIRRGKILKVSPPYYVVFAKGNQLSNRINAVNAPRAYLLDANLVITSAEASRGAKKYVNW